MTTKTIIITGASRGIGAATAKLAACQQYRVLVNYRNNRTAAEQTVTRIKQAGGIALSFQADVTDATQVESMFRFAGEQFGTVDALVNNAGILETQARLEEMDLRRWERIFAANVYSCFLCCGEAVKMMSSKYGGRGGAIVNVSSVAARTGSPNEYVDYAASKGAVDAMTIGLAKEVAGEGIRVNGVRPGFIYTDIHASGGEPGRVDRVKTAVPMQRGGQPEEVAEAILWLLSDKSSFVTGSILDIAGGR